jgi:hypothetical protein
MIRSDETRARCLGLVGANEKQRLGPFGSGNLASVFRIGGEMNKLTTNRPKAFTHYRGEDFE